MSERLAGKTAFVTAAGDGIGRAIAIALAAEGATVTATSRTKGKLAVLKKRGIARVAALDVSDAGAVAEMASGIAKLDILVNCAGLVCTDTVLTASRAQLANVIGINLFGAFHVTQALLPAMITAGGGAIINIASIISSLKAAPGRFTYGTSKGALIGMTRSIACDYAEHRIRCNAICPGTIETPSLKRRIASAPDSAAERRQFLSRHPIGRLGQPNDVAALTVHLAGNEAGFTTGQTFVLDGGWTI